MHSFSMCVSVRRRRVRARRFAPLVAAAMSLGVGACDMDSILNVQDPDIVTPENLSGPAGLATLHAGALGDFAIALSGSAAGHGATPALIQYTSSFTDEATGSTTFPTRIEFDRRRVQDINGDLLGLYTNLHRARAAAGNAGARLAQAATGTGDPRVAEMRSIAAFTYVFLGENFCSGVPISTATPSGELIFGEPRTRDQLFEDAVSRFDSALASTAGSATQQNLARVGKGRALLDLGRFADAAAAVAAVPTDFAYIVEYNQATTRQTNGVYFLSTIDRQYSVSDREGINGQPFRSANDVRAPWSRTAGEVGQDGTTAFFQQLKYPDPGSPTPVATGTEARLIEAEAQLQADNLGVQWIMTLNALRSGAGLPLLVNPPTYDERVSLHFAEQAFWLYMTGHRLGDLRRLVRQYGRGAETVFPTGPFLKGGVYGTDVNFPVPNNELNNPNFTGCLDRDA